MENICEIDKSNLIIVTHGGTLAYIIAWWLKFTPEMLNTAYFSGSVGSISLLNNNSFKQNILQLFNDTSHLV